MWYFITSKAMRFEVIRYDKIRLENYSLIIENYSDAAKVILLMVSLGLCLLT